MGEVGVPSEEGKATYVVRDKLWQVTSQKDSWVAVWRTEGAGHVWEPGAARQTLQILQGQIKV